MGGVELGGVEVVDLVDVKGVVGFGDVREKMRDEREGDVVGCESDGIGRV